MTYESAEALLQGKDARGLSRERRHVRNNTVIHRLDDDTVAIRLHHTDVVTFHRDGRVILDSGGWRTATTKERINEFAPCTVYQKDFVWYVAPYGDWDHPVDYEDGMDVSALVTA